MSKRAVKRRPKPWPLARVREACTSAPAVWIALCDMAEERGSPVVTPTREELVKRTGIKRLPTITAALTALVQASWIDREHVPITQGGRQTATMLRIVVRRSAQKTFATGRNTVAHRKRSTASAQKSFADSSYGRGARTPRLQRGGTQPADPNSQQPVESDATRIERERMAAILARREAAERGELEPVGDNVPWLAGGENQYSGVETVAVPEGSHNKAKV